MLIKEKFRFLFRGACLLIACAAFLSCGPGKIGYGVLLWPENAAAPEAGSVLPVYEESRLKQTYITGGPEDKTREMAVWRLAFFSEEEAAGAFAAGFEGVKDLYARANRNALPVREKADRLSRQVYRLRQNETMKVLELSTSPSDENGLQGYWYKVLTEEGVTGYCFNYYLTLFNAKTNTVITTSADSSQEALAAILTNPWRPVSFAEMTAAGRIDLARFRPEYGLFFDEEPRQIRIVLAGVSLTVPFLRMRKITGDTYITEGADIQFQLRAENTEIAVSYSYNGSRRADVFTAFTDNVEELIAKEEARRQEALLEFLGRGGLLRSDAYGEISVSGTGDFSWTENSRLVPSVIASGAGSSGKLEFSVFMSGELRNAYAGVITFRFTGASGPAHFFYRFTQQGTQLIHIPSNNIEDNLVRRRPVNPLVLFFTPY